MPIKNVLTYSRTPPEKPKKSEIFQGALKAIDTYLESASHYFHGSYDIDKPAVPFRMKEDLFWTHRGPKKHKDEKDKKATSNESQGKRKQTWPLPRGHYWLKKEKTKKNKKVEEAVVADPFVDPRPGPSGLNRNTTHRSNREESTETGINGKMPKDQRRNPRNERDKSFKP